MNTPAPVSAQPGPPLWLLAEVTCHCPLHCACCYKPVDFAHTPDEASADDWLRVLREAPAAGSGQCGFSDGEPLLRDDLEGLVAEAHRPDFYTKRLAYGGGLTLARTAALKQAGLDSTSCRCQAYMLTGDAAAADPVCTKSTRHERLMAAVARPTVTKPLSVIYPWCSVRPKSRAGGRCWRVRRLRSPWASPGRVMLSGIATQIATAAVGRVSTRRRR